MKQEKRLITKAGLRIGGLASKTRQKITTTGLRNGLDMRAEQGKINSLRSASSHQPLVREEMHEDS